jgi:hypothetical protein
MSTELKAQLRKNANVTLYELIVLTKYYGMNTYGGVHL